MDADTRARFDEVDERFDEVDKRFGAKFDGLVAMLRVDGLSDDVRERFRVLIERVGGIEQKLAA